MQHLGVFLVTLLLFIRGSTATDCSAGIGGTILVDKSGSANFDTIQAAINSIPQNNNVWIKIQINPGVYNEQVTIPKNKPCVFLEGQGRDVTTITFDAHQSTGTSATFTSLADDIVVNDITFKNSFNYPLATELYEMKDVVGVLQAVAARISGDRSAFFDCGFFGLQDTLWDELGRHYFSNCYIQGGIDFIFGSGQSFYENCEINASGGSYSPAIPQGYITAQGRQSAEDPSGFVFRGGRIFGDLPVYLGRAYGPFSRVIFIETIMDPNVIPQGWDTWKYPGQEDRFTYAESNCGGPGSDISKRVPWEKQLGLSELHTFSTSSVFIDQDGWLQETQNLAIRECRP